jgi:hypothetical protein
VDAVSSRLRIGRRFRGPPGIANGGFASGSLAALLGGAVEVSLRRSVPLERPLGVRHDGDGALLLDDDGRLLAEARPPGDGLRIFPGPMSRRSVWAAPWRPDPSVGGPDGQARDEVVWAALDCPGGVAAVEAAAVPAGTPVLLGQMTARLGARPRIGTEYRMVAWLLGRDGRKFTAGSALLGPDGEVLAAARALWVTVARTAGGAG